MFERAAAILNPGSPTTPAICFEVKSPEGVRKESANYWKSKYTQLQEKLTARGQEILWRSGTFPSWYSLLDWTPYTQYYVMRHIRNAAAVLQ